MKNCKSNNNAKIIEGLEETISYLRTRTGEVSERCIQYQREAIAMLKEQEPVKAIADGEDSYMCNNCGTVIGWAELELFGIEEVKYKFCPECGRKVKWE